MLIRQADRALGGLHVGDYINTDILSRNVPQRFSHVGGSTKHVRLGIYRTTGLGWLFRIYGVAV